MLINVSSIGLVFANINAVDEISTNFTSFGNTPRRLLGHAISSENQIKFQPIWENGPVSVTKCHQLFVLCKWFLTIPTDVVISRANKYGEPKNKE